MEKYIAMDLQKYICIRDGKPVEHNKRADYAEELWFMLLGKMYPPQHM